MGRRDRERGGVDQLASGHLADTLYLDPTSAGVLLGLVYAQAPSGRATVAEMQVISSAGLAPSAPVAIVGASQQLIVAGTEGARSS